MADARRTLTYRRAVWTDSEGANLQQFVDRIHSGLPQTASRVFDYKGSEIQGLAYKKRNGLSLVHVAQYNRGRSASLVPRPSKRPSLDTSELPPPSDSEFLHGDIMFLVKGDHVLICPSGAREAVIGAYLEATSEKLGFGSWVSRCALEPVANLPQVRLIHNEGVKKIRLNASLYEASMAYEDEKQGEVRTVLFGKMGEAVHELFRRDPRLSDIGDSENISVRLVISYDRRRKGGKLGQERMESMAHHLIDENAKDFQIITNDDKVIEPGELKIRQPLALPVYGSSIHRDAAWVALEEFFKELEASGAIET